MLILQKAQDIDSLGKPTMYCPALLVMTWMVKEVNAWKVRLGFQ